MRIYLDNCCFNRPFDPQIQVRVRIETEAKLKLQFRVTRHQIELAWSYMLDFENSVNPYAERRAAIDGWKRRAMIDISETTDVRKRARDLAAVGLRAKDAIHLACAEQARCDYFVTTDDLILKKMQKISGIPVMNPAQLVTELD